LGNKIRAIKKTPRTTMGAKWGLERELLLAETLFERCNTAASIEDTLLACVERMAYRANFNIDRAGALR
jgi:hypothetical protein